MMQQRQIAINAAAGALTIIRCSLGQTNKMSIIEDGASNNGAEQGLQYQLFRLPYGGENLAGKTTQMIVDSSGYQRLYVVEPLITVPPNHQLEPILIEGYPHDNPPHTAPIGNAGSGGLPVCPGGPVTDGTPILQIRSFGLATNIDVTEWSA